MSSQKEMARRYPARKTAMYQRIIDLASSYSVIGVSKLHKVRASQLTEIRKRLRNKVILYGIKNKLVAKALNELGLANIDRLIGTFEGQVMLLFTDMNPFKLQLLLEKAKVDMPARPGDIASSDIVVPAGNTGIPPGPVLSTFKKFKIPTRIESGSIFISKDTIVVRSGEEISTDMASLLSKLGLKPIKAGLSLEAVYWKGMIISREELRLDVEGYESRIREAFGEAFQLSVESGYPTRETMIPVLRRAVTDAKELALAMDYPTTDTIRMKIERAATAANLIAQKLVKKG